MPFFHLVYLFTINYCKDIAGVFWTFLFPYLLLFIFMALYPEQSVHHLVSGLLVMTLLATSLFGFSVVLVDWRNRGFFSITQIWPISSAMFVFAMVVSRTVILSAFSIIFVATAFLIYEIPLPRKVDCLFVALALLLCINFTFLALGFLLSATVHSISAANGLANIIYFPAIFFSDLFYTQQNLPLWLTQIVNLFPFRDSVYSLRKIFLDCSINNHMFPVFQKLFLWLLLLLVLSFFAIKWSKKHH